MLLILFSVLKVSSQIIFVSPVGGEQYELGSAASFTIQSNTANSLETYTYLVNPDGNYEYISYNSTPSGATFNLNYTFPYNKTISDQYRIAVYCNWPHYTYVYSSYFEVIAPTNPALLIQTPQEFRFLDITQLQTIEFYSFNIDNVDIEYSMDNGTTWETTLLADNLAVTEGLNSLEVMFPYVEGIFDESLIRIKDAVGITESQVEVYLSSEPMYEFTAPVENTVFEGGSELEFTIVNNYQEDYLNDISIYFGQNELDNYYIDEDFYFGENTYSILLDANYPAGEFYRLAYEYYDDVLDHDIVYFSDYFTITEPDNKIISVLEPGNDWDYTNYENLNVIWASNQIDFVDIDLFYGYDGTDYELNIVENLDISDETQLQHSYEWLMNIPNMDINSNTDYCYIKVTNSNDIEDFADSYEFSVYNVEPYIWDIYTYQILTNSWYNTNYFSNGYDYIIEIGSFGISQFDIEYSLNGGTDWTILAENLITEDSYFQYYWEIPVDMFDNYYPNSLIRVTGLGYDNVEYTNTSSTKTFSNEQFVEFISPVLNEEFDINDLLSITIKNNSPVTLYLNDVYVVNNENWIYASSGQQINSGEQGGLDVTLSDEDFLGSQNNYIYIALRDDSYNWYYVTSENLIINGTEFNLALEYDEYEDEFIDWHYFEGIEVGEMSDIQTLIFSADNLTEDLLLNIPEGFYASLDGVNYFTDSEIIIPTVDGAIENGIVYYYFMPNDENSYDGYLEFYTENLYFADFYLRGWGYYNDSYEFISADRYLIDFGDVEVFSSKVETINLHFENLIYGLWLDIYYDDKNLQEFLISIDGINYFEYLEIENPNIEDLTVYVKFTPSEVDEYPYWVLEVDGYNSDIEIDVMGNGVAKNTPILNVSENLNFFGNLLVGQISEIQSFNLDANNLLTDVTITTPEGFYVSTDGETFVTELTISPNENGTVENAMIYVVFEPEMEMTYLGYIEIFNEETQPFSIMVQGAAGQPFLTSATEEKYVTSLAGTDFINVLSNVNWTASAVDTWVSILNSGSGNDKLYFSFEDNMELDSRFTTVTISGDNGVEPIEITVYQDGFQPIIEPEIFWTVFTSVGGTNEILINSNVIWEADTEADWFTIEWTGDPNSPITITADENLSDEQKDDIINIYIEGETDPFTGIEVYQFEFMETLIVNPVVFETDYNEGSTIFDIEANLEWTATSTEEWFTVSELRGDGSGVIEVNFEKNYDEERYGYIYIESGDLDQVITIKQGPMMPELAVSTNLINETDFAGTDQFDIYSNTFWTAGSDQSWCVISEEEGLENATIDITFETNLDVERTAHITIMAGDLIQVVEVVQAEYSNPTFNFDFQNQDVTFEEGSVDFEVTTTIEWSADSDSEWCTIEISKADGTITATYEANTGGIRIATITLTGENPYDGITGTITVTQDAFVGISDLSLSGISVYPNPTNGKLEVKSEVLSVNKVVITDIIGKTISTFSNSQFDLSNNSNGVYFIKIYTDNGIFTEKIVKQ